MILGLTSMITINSCNAKAMSKSKNTMAFLFRALSAGAKFVLVMYLGSLGDKSLLGEFAIFATLVTVFTQIAGLEINQVVARRIQVLSKEERVVILVEQAFCALLAYAILLPIFIVSDSHFTLGIWLLGAGVMIFEHVATEIYRLQLIDLKPLKASALLFLKNSSWVFLFIVSCQFLYFKPTFYLMLSFWLASLVFVIAVAKPISMRNLRVFLENFTLRGVRSSISLVADAKFFLVSAASVSAISAVDKIIISKFFILEQLGNFYFFQTLGSIPAMIVSFTIGTTLWPRCIHESVSLGASRALPLWNTLRNRYTLTLLFSSVVVFLVFILFNEFAHKNYQKNDYNMFFLVLIASVMMCASEPYKLFMYMNSRDVHLMKLNITHFAVVACCVFLAAQTNDMLNVCLALLAANVIGFAMFKIFSSAGRVRT